MSDFTDKIAREHRLVFLFPPESFSGEVLRCATCDYIAPDERKWDEDVERRFERKHIAEVTLALFKEEVLEEIISQTTGYPFSIDYSDGLWDAAGIIRKKG